MKSSLLKFIAALSIAFLFSTAVHAQAANVTAIASVGKKVTFSLNAGSLTGTPPFTYQWFKGTTPISGATAPMLVLPSVTVADSGSYSLVVTNPAGSTTSNLAIVTVTPIGPGSVSISVVIE